MIHWITDLTLYAPRITHHASHRQRQTIQIAGIVGQHLNPILGDDDGVRMAEATQFGHVQARLDGKDHAGPEFGLAAQVEEGAFVVTQMLIKTV